MKSFFFILFCTQFVLAQQIPLDSISYEAYYGDELKQIVALKAQQKRKVFSAELQLEIGKLYQQINSEDSAYVTYYKVYEFEDNNKVLSTDAFENLLFRLHEVESSKSNYNKDRRYFLNKLKQITKKTKSDKWFAKIKFESFKDFFLDSIKYEKAEALINRIKETKFYNKNKGFQTSVLLSYGYFKIKQKKYQEAEKILFKAYNLAKKNNDTLNQIYSYINLSLSENYRTNYEKALYYINRAASIPNHNYKIKIARLIALHKGNAYYGLNDSISLKQQDLRYVKLDSVINDFRKNSNFYEIDVAYQTKEKDQKIAELSSFKKTFQKNKIVYSVLLFGVFLLALYSFVRWKKSDKNKAILDQQNKTLHLEHKKAKSELETVKSLVTNDYIILKNKSKLYLKELIYIKSDGHYLNLFTTLKKDFVRGKISEIEKQLPPNFVKCHRSYIVNTNFIKDFKSTEVSMTNNDVVPISRGFKF